MSRAIGMSVLACVLIGSLAGAAPMRVGFTGSEAVKLDWGTHNLHVGDVNGDGLGDIVVVNNARARVECLIQRAEPEPTPPADLKPNELPDSAHFKRRPFLSEKHIYSLALGDLNSDGRTDMVYYGDPPELVVVYQNEEGEWGRRREFDITDGSHGSFALTVGDTNGDSLEDIVLLAEGGAYFIYQAEDGTLETPVKETGVASDVRGIALRDVNGDELLDLISVSFTEPEPLSIRLQDADGRLGPGRPIEGVRLRAIAFGDPRGSGRSSVVAIKMKSGRLVQWDVTMEEPEGPMLDGAMERYTLRGGNARQTPAAALGAFSEEGRLDLVVTVPDANEVEMLFQTESGYWAGRASFASLQDVTQLAVIDSDDDGLDELLLLSRGEEILGHASMDERGRWTFPRALRVPGKPTAVAVGDLENDGIPEIICGINADGDRSIVLLRRNEEGEYDAAETLPIEEPRADADGVMVFDLNQDGRQDICVFIPYEGMRVFTATAEGGFTDASREPDYGKGLVQNAKLKATGAGDINGDGKPELLLAEKNFARALRLDDAGRLEVVDQFNGRMPTSVIEGVSGADLNDDGTPEIVLVDSATRSLTVLRQNDLGVYGIEENVKITPLAFQELVMCGMDATPGPELLLLTRTDCRVLRPGRPKLTAREAASYATETRDGLLADVVCGDFNADGRDELLLNEVKENSLEIVAWDPESEDLVKVANWRIFEPKNYAGSRYSEDQDAIEPREFEIADVTGDARPDIILLIHDRVIVYPQE